MPKVGHKAPGFTLPTLDGKEFSLTGLLHGGKHALLIFLRHLG